MPDAMLLVDLPGQCLDANTRAQELLGANLEALRGVSVAEMLGAWPPEIVRTWYAVDARRQDGAVVPALISAAPLPGTSGSGTQFVVLLRLAGERTGDEAAWAKLSTIVTSSPAPILGMTLDGIIISWNPAAEQLYGYSTAEAVGESVLKLQPPELPDSITPMVDVVRRGESVRDYESVRMTKDGRRVLVSLSAAPIRDRGGEIIGISTIAWDITAQREAERTLRLWERALNAAPSGIIISAPTEGGVRIIDVNPTFEAITGYCREEILGGNFSFLEGPDTDQEALRNFRVKLQAGQDVTETLVNYRKDGTSYWAEVRMAPVWDEAGAITNIVGIHTDVTARLEAEQGLRLWERARNAAPSSIVVTDAALPSSRIIEVNQAFETMTGYTKEEVLGRDFGFLRGPDTDPEALARMVEEISAGRDVTETLLNYRKDGAPYWVEIHISAVRNERGEVTNYVAIQVDVTERKAAAEALARERDLLTALMDHLPDAVYVKDASSRFLRLNQATAEELGVPDPAEALGKTDRNFFPAALAREYRADERALLQTGEPMLNKTERQIVGGEERWVLATKAPLRDSRGKVIGLVGSNRDITAMRQLQEERDRLHAELQAEIQRTAEIQAQLLPHAAPDLPEYEFAGICLPARQVGGDFFDWLQDGADARLSLGDVMGKGLPASLLTATVRAALRSVAYLPVSEAVEAVNRALYPDLSQSDSFITLFHASLQAATGAVTYVDAGHGLALLLRGDGSVEPLRQRQVPLGVLADTAYPATSARLAPGDTLLLYSDGLPDARPDLRLDPAGIAAAIGGLSGAEARLERLVTLAGEAGSRPDDLTLVLVHRR